MEIQNLLKYQQIINTMLLLIIKINYIFGDKILITVLI